MLLPDWDYGGPSCSLKTSGVRVVWGLVVLIVAYSTAAPGLCSSAFQRHIGCCPRTGIIWEADRQSAVTPAAVVYDVTAHSFPLRQSVWVFGSFTEGVELSLPTLKSLRWERPWQGKGQTGVVSSAEQNSPWLTCQRPRGVKQHSWGIAALVLWTGTLQRKGPVSWSGLGSAVSRCSSGPTSASEGSSPEKN